MPVAEGVWRVFGGFRRFWRVWYLCKPIESYAAALTRGCLLGKWPWPWGACWGRCLEGLEGLDGFGGCLEGLEGFGGFGGFGGFWRVFGGFWSVWRVLERLECLRAGKRQL